MQDLEMFAVINFSILVIIWVVGTIISWATDDDNKTLVENLIGQYRFIKRLMQRIY
jgi:hypothetical protein